MEEKPLISIIVPVYNAQDSLSQCINSILSQTFSNFELLLIDDGSNDLSGNICDEYLSRDNRVRVYHTINSGVSAARNLGLNLAVGEYIGFVDSDDYVEEEYLDHLYQLFSLKTEGLGFVVQGCKKYKDSLVIRSTDFQKRVFRSSELPTLFTQKNDLWGLFSPCAKLFQRSLLLQYNIRFDTAMCCSEDIPFILNCMHACDYIVMGDHRDYCYISTSNTVSTTLYQFDSIYYAFTSCNDSLSMFIENYNISDDELKKVYGMIDFLFSTLLKVDYHEKKRDRKVRISHFRFLYQSNFKYLSLYHSPDYLMDKIGTTLLIRGYVVLYDILFSALFAVGIKKMYLSTV